MSRPSALKQAVKERAQGCCEYCRSQSNYSHDPFSVDHIIPRARGGSNALDNLALACLGCNNRKHTAMEAVDPITNSIVPLFHPRRDHWNDHFAWSADFTLIQGQTPTGRATVRKLALNRPAIINLRRALVAFKQHPSTLPTWE